MVARNSRAVGGIEPASPYARAFEETLSTDLGNLESGADEMRRTGYATIGRLVDGILSLGMQPARSDLAAVDLGRRLLESAPLLDGLRKRSVASDYRSLTPRTRRPVR